MVITYQQLKSEMFWLRLVVVQQSQVKNSKLLQVGMNMMMAQIITALLLFLPALPMVAMCTTWVKLSNFGVLTPTMMTTYTTRTCTTALTNCPSAAIRVAHEVYDALEIIRDVNFISEAINLLRSSKSILIGSKYP